MLQQIKFTVELRKRHPTLTTSHAAHITEAEACLITQVDVALAGSVFLCQAALVQTLLPG